MDFEMHDRSQNQQTVRLQDTMDLINGLLWVGEVFKGFEVEDQTDALIRDRLHIGNIADNIDTGRIEILNVLFEISLAREKGLIKIRLPPSTGIQNRFLIREPLDGPSHIIHDRFSQRALLSGM